MGDLERVSNDLPTRCRALESLLSDAEQKARILQSDLDKSQAQLRSYVDDVRRLVRENAALSQRLEQSQQDRHKIELDLGAVLDEKGDLAAQLKRCKLHSEALLRAYISLREEERP